MGGILEIGGGAFQRCFSLKTVTIPSTVKIISDFAFFSAQQRNGEFDGCGRQLSEVKINEGVEVIGRQAFRGCSSLVRINIPSSIKRIMYCAFEGCDRLVEVDLSDSGDWGGMLT